MKLGQTPSQTLGPFFAYGLVAEQYGYSNTQIASGVIEGEGERITITGRVLDGNEEPVGDALVEIWQPGAGFARVGTGTSADKSFSFNTFKPAAMSAAESPCVAVILFMRGLLSHLYTRIYFSDETEANARDTVLATLPPDRRHTLIAGQLSDREYLFDIHLQGEHETVFFDL
jgi:protocatechuate 3,4-dioxygenase, alpha subunit